jgi:hypothetical protein
MASLASWYCFWMSWLARVSPGGSGVLDSIRPRVALLNHERLSDFGNLRHKLAVYQARVVRVVEFEHFKAGAASWSRCRRW